MEGTRRPRAADHVRVLHVVVLEAAKLVYELIKTSEHVIDELEGFQGRGGGEFGRSGRQAHKHDGAIVHAASNQRVGMRLETAVQGLRYQSPEEVAQSLCCGAQPLLLFELELRRLVPPPAYEDVCQRHLTVKQRRRQPNARLLSCSQPRDDKHSNLCEAEKQGCAPLGSSSEGQHAPDDSIGGQGAGREGPCRASRVLAAILGRVAVHRRHRLRIMAAPCPWKALGPIDCEVDVGGDIVYA
eukprot:756852-Hanusia_phi.AAC.2